MYREFPEEFHEICENFDVLPFSNFQPWLGELNIGEENASSNFLIDYYSAKCRYTDEWIGHIFQRVAQENAKKYDKLLAIWLAEYNPLDNYNRIEESTHTRTPDISRAVSSSASEESASNSTSDVSASWTRSTTEDAGTYKDQTDQFIAPEDTDTPHLNTRMISEPSGIRTTTESYEGDPDTRTAESSGTRSTTGSSTQTETGTETTEIESHIHGNIGVTLTQVMAEREMALAAKMNIFKEIEKDIAAKLFIQVW